MCHSYVILSFISPRSERSAFLQHEYTLAVPLEPPCCAETGRVSSRPRAPDGSHRSPPRKSPALLEPATHCPSLSTRQFEYPLAGSQENWGGFDRYARNGFPPRALAREPFHP